MKIAPIYGRKVALLIALILLGVFPALSQEASSPKTNDKAVVYFYSLATMTTMGRVRKPVFLDDKEIADIRPEHYFIVLVEPGKHTFSLRNKKFGGVEMDFVAGTTYYLRMEWKSGMALTPNGISNIQPESGGYDVKQLTAVNAENIKNKEIAFTALPK